MNSVHEIERDPAIEMRRLLDLLKAQGEALRRDDEARLTALTPLLERQLTQLNRMLGGAFSPSSRDEERVLRGLAERIQRLVSDNAAGYRRRKESVERARMQLRSATRFTSQAFSGRRRLVRRIDLKG